MKQFSPPFKRHTDKRNLEWMIGALKDENIQVRKKAAYVLGVISDRRAVEPLINALKDSTWSVRDNAARALGKIGDPRAIEPLTDALKDSKWLVRSNAKAALRKTQAQVGKKKQDPAVAASENALSGGIVLGVGSSGIGIGMGDSLMESLVKMGTKCRKCGSEIIFEDGAACARKNGIRDNVVMCKKCRSVYEVDLSPSGMSLTTDVSHKYRK